MRDAAVVLRLEDGPPARASDLGGTVGAVCRRLAELMRALPVEDPRIADGASFLQGLALDGSAWAEAEVRFGRLVEAFGLGTRDVLLVVLAGLPDHHEGIATSLAALHPAGTPRSTVGLAARLDPDDGADRGALREAVIRGPAVIGGLVRVEGTDPFYNRTLVPAPELWSALLGHDAWPRCVAARRPDDHGAGLDEWLAGDPARRAVRALGEGRRVTVGVRAPDPDVAVDRAAALVRAAGREPVLLTIPCEAEARLLSALAAHVALREVVPLFVQKPSGEGSRGEADLPDCAGPLVLCGGEGALRYVPDRPALEVSAGTLPPRERVRVWRTVMPELPGDAGALATSFTLEGGRAARVARDARLVAALADRGPTATDVIEAVRTRGGAVEAAGVALRRPRAAWSELVVPSEAVAQLRDAVDRVRHAPTVLDEWGFGSSRPGTRGVSVLLVGPPGTGKSFSAEVLAGALGVDLLQVDLARVLSKWLGETERNLSAVFDAAERSQAVLLFDEADAVFARRTQVSDAHDRYANTETAHLLSRVERYEGLVVLTTNLRRNIDGAFLRRMTFVIDLHEPTVEERRRLWEISVPLGAPVGTDVDLAELAALYPMTGALIRNAATAAAFQAAAAGSPIGLPHLVAAVRREFEKAGRPFPGPPSGLNAR